MWKNILVSMLIGWWIGPLNIQAGGIHTHLPRGADQDAFHDSVEVDPGDLFIAAKGEIDTVEGTVWEDAAATELSPTFSAINSAFSSALSGYSLNVTGLNLSALTGSGETSLHSHAGGNGGLANNDTTDTLIVNNFLRVDDDFYVPEQAVTLHYAIGAGNGYNFYPFCAYDGNLYGGNDHGAWGTVYRYTGTGTWSQFIDPGNSWQAESMVVFKGKLYVGWGNDTNGKGDISSFDGTTWVQEYATDTYQVVFCLAVYGDSLYAGLGTGVGEGDILSSVDGSNWQITHDTADHAIRAMAVHQGKLYASSSTAASGGYGYLWEFDGAVWTGIGAPEATTHDIHSMASYNGLLYMGMGNGSDKGDLWTWDGYAFDKPVDTIYYMATWLQVYRDKLYIGFHDPSDKGDICILDGEEWYSDPIFDNTHSFLQGMGIYKDKLFIGTGGTGSSEGDVYVYYAGYRDGTPERTVGEHRQHFANVVTFQDSSQFTGPVEIKGTLHVGFSGAETPQGGGPLVQFSVATSPQIAPVHSAVLWAEALGAGDVELYAMDSGGNKAPLTANVKEYPPEMAVSATRPYVTTTENIQTDVRTYIAMNRAMELLQQIARREGLLSNEAFIIMHVDRHHPGALIKEKKRKSFFERLW